MLLRLFDTNEGTITLDTVPVTEIDLKHLREKVSYVPQDVFLFSDTIRNNIAFGKDHADTQEVEQAARAASIHQEILNFSQQYDMIIGERGVTLSGGQKQRISIARALLKNAPIIILDDCLSAVDAKTEKTIIANLAGFLEGKTSIIITHRIFSLFSFDKIIVMENGRIAEIGTHEELLKTSDYYQYLYEHQQEEKEDETEAAEIRENT